MNVSGPALNLYARLQSRVVSNGSIGLMQADLEKGKIAGQPTPMCDALGQAWTLPGLIGRHWTLGNRTPEVEVMEAGLRLSPEALGDRHSLAWVMAGTFKPFQWMQEQASLIFVFSPGGQQAPTQLNDFRGQMAGIMQNLAPDERLEVEQQTGAHLLEAVQRDLDDPEHSSKSIQRWLNASSRWLEDMTIHPSPWAQPYPSPMAQTCAHILVMHLFLMERTGVYSYSVVEALTPIGTTEPPKEWQQAQGSVALRQAWLDVALGCLGSPVSPIYPNSPGGEASAGALRVLWGLKAVATLMEGAPEAELAALYVDLKPILPALELQLNLLRNNWDVVVPFGDRSEVQALKEGFLDILEVRLREARLNQALPRPPSASRLRM